MKDIVAFFDFDGTLTRGDTLMPFVRHVVGPTRFYAGLVLLTPVLAGYFARVVPNHVAKEAVLRHYFGGRALDELFIHGGGFCERVLPDMMHNAGMECLAWHLDQGHECVLVSASLDVYLQAWAEAQGFHAVLCSALEHQDGRITGRLLGNNCYGREKVSRIRAWLAERRPQETWAYGDTSGDLHMLRMVDRGFWVKGDSIRRL